jgi:hypothetical protein
LILPEQASEDSEEEGKESEEESEERKSVAEMQKVGVEVRNGRSSELQQRRPSSKLSQAEVRASHT